jgi:glycosyltransferase 2 family protein
LPREISTGKHLRETKIAIEPGWFALWRLPYLSIANLLAVVRWGWIMRSMGLRLPISRYITLYFAGGLINQGLPSTIGGDSYRAVEGSRLGIIRQRQVGQPAGTRAPTLAQELHQPIDLNRAPPRLRLGLYQRGT